MNQPKKEPQKQPPLVPIPKLKGPGGGQGSGRENISVSGPHKQQEKPQGNPRPKGERRRQDPAEREHPGGQPRRSKQPPAQKTGAIPEILPREPLIKKAFAAISKYASNLYAWLAKHGFWSKE